MRLVRYVIFTFVFCQLLLFNLLAMEKDPDETKKKQFFAKLVIPKELLETPENKNNFEGLNRPKISTTSSTVPNIPIKTEFANEEEKNVVDEYKKKIVPSKINFNPYPPIYRQVIIPEELLKSEHNLPEDNAEYFDDLKDLENSPFIDNNESYTNTKDSQKKSNVSQLAMDGENLYDTEIFIGELPSGSKHLLTCFKDFSLIRNVFPMLIKVTGTPFSGKTTYVRHIAKEIKCTPSQYLEIGSLKNIFAIKEILNSRDINIEKFPQKTDKLKVLETIITAFYNQKAIYSKPFIINFTAGLGLTDIGLKKLRESIRIIQKGEIAPLTIFYETKSDNSTTSQSENFLDQVIHILPPSPEDIKALLIHTFINRGGNYRYEEITPETLEKFVHSSKTPYTRPHIIRIAEKIIRTAKLKYDKAITNERIVKVLMNRDD